MSKPVDKAEKSNPALTEEYIRGIKKRASPTAELAEDINQARINKIKSLVQEVQLRQVEKEAKGLVAPDQNLTNAISTMFQGRSVEEINKFLKEMTPEVYEGLKKMATLNADSKGPLVVKEAGSMNDKILEKLLEKAMQPPPQQNMSELIVGIAKLMEVMQSKQQPVVQQAAQGPSTLEIFKAVSEIQKPFYDRMTAAEQRAQDAKLREIEAKMPPDPIEQIKYMKEVVGTLGLGEKGTSELDLKLEEMKQNREIDIEKLKWEQRKFEMEADNDQHKWDQINKLATNVLQGPVGDVVKNLGSAGADRVRGKRNNNGGKLLKPVQTQCPNCHDNIFVDSEAETAICGRCGSVLQRQGNVQPAPIQPIVEPVEAEQPMETEGEEEEVEAETTVEEVAEEKKADTEKQSS